jgi:hypothetical protein
MGGINNIKMDLEETGWEGINWIHLAQYRDSWLVFVNAIMNFELHNLRGIP